MIFDKVIPDQAWIKIAKHAIIEDGYVPDDAVVRVSEDGSYAYVQAWVKVGRQGALNELEDLEGMAESHVDLERGKEK